MYGYLTMKLKSNWNNFCRVSLSRAFWDIFCCCDRLWCLLVLVVIKFEHRSWNFGHAVDENLFCHPVFAFPVLRLLESKQRSCHDGRKLLRVYETHPAPSDPGHELLNCPRPVNDAQILYPMLSIAQMFRPGYPPRAVYPPNFMPPPGAFYPAPHPDLR